MRCRWTALTHITLLILGGVSGYGLAKVQQRRTMYLQDLDSRVTNVRVSLDVLDGLRSQKQDKALLGLETAMLTDTASLADDEKALGPNADIQDTARRVADYCSKYRVFTGERTNLPSHAMAKRFLDSHNQ